MSVCVIAAYGSFSLLQALLLSAGMGAAAAGFEGSFFKSKAGNLAALKQKMLEDISAETGYDGEPRDRDRSAAREKLNEELQNFRLNLDRRLERDDPASVLAELHSLRRRCREEALDEEQCRRRQKDAAEKLSLLREKKIPSWENVLDRLEKKLKNPEGLSASERLSNLQILLEELAEMEGLASIAADQGADALKETLYPAEEIFAGRGQPQDDIRACIAEIRDRADRIAQMDSWEGEKLRPLLEGLAADTPFPERLDLLRRQVRAACSRLREREALTGLFREKLEELYTLVQAAQIPGRDFAREAEALSRRCETLCGGKYIDREAFMSLYEDVCRFVFSQNEDIADALLAQKVGDVLNELGYELLTDETPDETSKGAVPPDGTSSEAELSALAPDRVQYLESPYEGYQVMIRAGNHGEVAVRLVRTVADEAEKNAAGAYQRQKDLEVGKKWCEDFDRFLEKMREQGVPFDLPVRQEPEESEVLVVVDRNPAAKKRRKEKLRRPTLAEKTADEGVKRP